MLPDAHSAIEDGTWRFGPYGNANDDSQEQHRDAEQKRHDNVEAPPQNLLLPAPEVGRIARPVRPLLAWYWVELTRGRIDEEDCPSWPGHNKVPSEGAAHRPL